MKVLVFLLCSLASSVVLAQEADLSVTASPHYTLDGDLRLTATVRNDGPDDVMDIDVLIQFDTALVTASNLETGCGGSSVGVVCSFSELDAPVLASGDELIVELDLTPSEGAPRIEVSVSSTATDGFETNNTVSVPAFAPTTVDLSIDVRGTDDGTRKNLVFTAANSGPDEATRVRVSGTVTVNFDRPVGTSEVEMLTGMNGDDGAICGHQVSDVSEPIDDWTFPVTCALPEIAANKVVEFSFWFEQAQNARYRLDISSDALDSSDIDNHSDGDFLNSPIEMVEGEDDGGCTTVRGPQRPPALFPLIAMLLLGWRRR